MRIEDDAAWDDLVRASTAGTVFHTSEWMRASGMSFLRLGIEGEDRSDVGLALQVDGEGRGTLGSITPYLGPLVRSGCSGAPARRRLYALAQAAQEWSERPYFCSSPWAPDIQPFVIAGYVGTLLYTFVLSLRAEEGKEIGWRERLSPKLRRNLAAAGRDGIQVRVEEDPGTVLDLVQATFRRQGTEPWFSVAECDRALRAMASRDRARCFVALDSAGRPLAGAAVVWDDRRAHYLLGGSREESRHRGGASLALYEAITYCEQEQAIVEFDFEGTFVPQVESFLREFGGESLPFFFLRPARAPLIMMDNEDTREE